MTQVHNAGHKARGRVFCRYTVYDNKTDRAVIYDGTAAQCAAALGRSKKTFYNLVDRVRSGRIKRWSVMKRYCDEEDEDGDS